MKKVISILFKYGVPIAVSVGLAYFLYANVDIKAIGDSLKQDVNYLWFLPVIAVSVMSHVFRALRWRLQLRAVGVNTPLSAIVNSIFGTYFVNLLFPRLGEVWRCGYIANREKAPLSLIVGSMVGDRLSDTLTVFLLTIFTFFLASDKLMLFLGERGNDGGSLLSSWWLWVSVVLCLLIAITLWWMMRSNSNNAVVKKTQSIMRELWNGFAAIWRMQGKWQFLCYTLCIWGCYFLQLYIASFAFSFTANLGVVAILVLFVLSSLGMAVPSNGGLGPWQYAIIFGLTLYGVGAFPLSTPYDPQASAFAWLVWGVQTCLLIVLGIYAFVSIEIDRRQLARKNENNNL